MNIFVVFFFKKIYILLEMDLWEANQVAVCTAELWIWVKNGGGGGYAEFELW
jgi:hypothetical protein